MEGKRFIQKIKLQNLLSYGPEGEEIELQPLNVLIGPNASGKSNLIEAISLLRATPVDLAVPIRNGGGITEWLWKGGEKIPKAIIKVSLMLLENYDYSVNYTIGFTSTAERLEIVRENIQRSSDVERLEEQYKLFYNYDINEPLVSLNTRQAVLDGDELISRNISNIPIKNFRTSQSVLYQLKDPFQYPEITSLGDQLSKIRFYREWNFGRNTPARQPQPTDLPEDFLLENASNLGLVLNALQNQRKRWRSIIEKLQKFYERADAITITVRGGTVQLFIHEDELEQPIPATRLSDGTLRWLCLLAILCHPEPPPLICIEEPEIGLHPDILPTLADLLIEASQRTQLIVTTHSDVLISALSSVPEAVIVCERDEKGTHLRRLDPEQLKEWLEKYSLGDLWLRGQLGGTRW